MLDEIERILQAGDHVRAMRLVSEYLNRYPDDIRAIHIYGALMLQTDHPGIAKVAFERVLADNERNQAAWINYGKSLDDMLLYEDARNAFLRAHSIDPTPLVMENLSVNSVHRCEPHEAIRWADRVLEVKPTSKQAQLNKAYAQLSLFDFKNGWPAYDVGMGQSSDRNIRRYADEPVWDGSPDKHVVVYGEQGLGDQIAFAGAIPDARQNCKSIVIDTHKKLVGLFRRSFLAETHGDMFESEIEWPYDRRNPFDASISLSQLQKFYRSETHQFPTKPYLLADPIRRGQWKHTFAEMGGRPKIGIAWTGGIHATDQKARSTELETLLPLFQLDVDFISLEYKDRSEEIDKFHVEHGIRIHDFPWATQTSDYDDTAALVAELDLVVSIPTSVVHLAGGLGVPCFCIVHERPHFMFGIEGDRMPFYNSVKLFRRGNDWPGTLSKLMESIHELHRHHPSRPWSRGNTPSRVDLSQDRFPQTGTV